MVPPKDGFAPNHVYLYTFNITFLLLHMEFPYDVFV
jgi:hypothetical protein